MVFNNQSNFTRPGKEKVLQESEVKEFIESKLSGYLDGKFRDIEDKFEEKIEKKETKTTEVLAIFITLFTFISANITIFTKITDLRKAAFFMLLMTICSITLLSFTFIVINDQKKNTFLWIGLLFSLFLLVGMLFGTSYISVLNSKF